MATSRVRVSRIWNLLTADDRNSVLLGVPGTYPPPPIRGCVVGDFLSPSTSSGWTYPNSLGGEIQSLVGDYMPDVVNFRTDDEGRVAQQVFDMTEQRLRVAHHLAVTRWWDFFAILDMGPDRLHHGFWAAYDPAHPPHDPSGPHMSLFRYYRALDRQIGALLETFDDDTVVLIASDHGAQPMIGGFCVNEWLREQGLLALTAEPARRTPIADAQINWRRTAAWAEGGYYARIFFKVAGREPEGVIAPCEYESTPQQVIDAVEAVLDHQGRPMGNRAFRPEEAYPTVTGGAPDLIVYLGDLRWRSVGILGLGQGLYTFENDTRPDDANHAELRVFALSGPGLAPGLREDLSIYDVTPTRQSLLNLPAPEHQSGRVLV